MKSQIEKIDLEQLLKGLKFHEEVLKNGFSKFDKLDLGKQVKWIKCKDRPDNCVHILDIREIDGKQFICLISRHFFQI